MLQAAYRRCNYECKYVKIPFRENTYYCPAHGDVHVCDQKTCLMNAPSVFHPRVCVWTGTNYGYHVSGVHIDGVLYGHDLSPIIPARRRVMRALPWTLVIPVLHRALSPDFRRVACADFWDKARLNRRRNQSIVYPYNFNTTIDQIRYFSVTCARVIIGMWQVEKTEGVQITVDMLRIAIHELLSCPARYGDDVFIPYWAPLVFPRPC